MLSLVGTCLWSYGKHHMCRVLSGTTGQRPEQKPAQDTKIQKSNKSTGQHIPFRTVDFGHKQMGHRHMEEDIDDCPFTVKFLGIAGSMPRCQTVLGGMFRCSSADTPQLAEVFPPSSLLTDMWPPVTRTAPTA